MDWDGWKRFGMVWFAIILPVCIFLIAMLSGASVLWMFLVLIWICAGIMIVVLPSTTDTADQ